MRCQRCKEKEANVKIMKQTSGKAPQMLMLCDECARQLGISLPGGLLGGALGGVPSGMNPLGGFSPLSGIAGGMGTGMTSPLDILASAFETPFGLGLEDATEGQDVACPQCGITRSQFTRNGFLGCPDCYETFSAYIDPMFLRTQMGSKHVGRKPGNTGDVDAITEKEKETPTFTQIETPADSFEGLPEEEKNRKMTIMEKERLLKKAVKEENYAEAAKLRDEISALKKEGEK